jgi:hypothetical protein
LGKSKAANPELDVVSAALAAGEASGLSDAFTLYLQALIAMDRWAGAGRNACSTWC